MADVLPADLVVLYQVSFSFSLRGEMQTSNLTLNFIQDSFFTFDTDQDGVILTRQLGELLRLCGENPSEAEVQVPSINLLFYWKSVSCYFG